MKKHGVPCPPSLQWLWDVFIELSNIRQISTIAQPIPFSEIGAYSRELKVPLSVWERRLLRKVDDAVLAIVNRPKNKDRISMKDTKGVAAMFRGMKVQQKRGGTPK